jgi:hypothetical protein
MRRPADELREGATPLFDRVAPGAIVLLRYVIPLVLAVILWLSVRRFYGMLLG